MSDSEQGSDKPPQRLYLTGILSEWLSDEGPEWLEWNAAYNSEPATGPLQRLQPLRPPPTPPSPPLKSPNLRPISQQDPRGHFQKQSLSLSSQEVPGLIINKLLMSEQRIAPDCASALNVCMCVCVREGQRKVLLDGAFNWPFNRAA